ncbi:MAG TPA: DUF4139 domain-containing protein [Mucilaginibacter sp.]|jgi:hypothetical protein|nr:DUF4139 domain-containing protein [Mucilaginibacter sp.]
MLKNLMMAAALFCIAAMAKADEGQRTSSKVEKVTVFLNGAQVTRTAMVSINAGTSQLVFGGISPEVDAQSIQVHANGAFTIQSVKHELDFLSDQVKIQRVEDIRVAEKAIRDKISLQNSLTAIYQAEENMIAKNQDVSTEANGLDVLKLKQALDFQTERLTDLKQKEIAVANQVEALNLELNKYEKQIAEIDRGRTSATSNIIVTVSSKTALESHFTLTYVIRDASWYPTYDIRAKNVSSPVEIAYKANVSQNSGEDWKNVKLTLSTGNPSVSGNKPELSPDYLSLNMYYVGSQGPINRVTGKVTGADDKLPVIGASIRIKGTSIGAVSDVNGNYSLQMPSGSQTLVVSYIGYVTLEKPVSSSVLDIALTPSASTLNEVVVTGYSSSGNDNYYAPAQSREVKYKAESIPVGVTKTENQTNIEFAIDDPYSVPGDGKQYTVDINQVEVKAGYQYAVTPKLSTDVFLTAKLTDWNKYNFLSGEANLFFEGTFIGKSLLNTDATKDTLDISLGADKNIVVTRTSLKDLSAKQSLGSNKKETKDWQIEVKNRKGQTVNLLVEDQVPVSQNKDIEVETQELSGGKADVITGKVCWYFALNADDDKKVELKYQVKYPKDQTVIVQ